MTIDVITRDVIGYEELYTVDIFGNVVNKKTNKEVKQYKNKFGYMNVVLYKDKKQHQYKVHRLIAEAFIPNPQNKKQVNHIDGNKSHNVVWNLEWSTPKENIKHALSTGLRKNVKVKVVETGKIYTNAYECAKDIDGNAADIYRCLRGKTKTHKKLHFEEVK